MSEAKSEAKAVVHTDKSTKRDNVAGNKNINCLSAKGTNEVMKPVTSA